MEHDKRHGGAFDRGSADAYYGRGFEPHKYHGATHHGPRVSLTDPAEIEAYRVGYETQDERKDWVAGEEEWTKAYLRMVNPEVAEGATHLLRALTADRRG